MPKHQKGLVESLSWKEIISGILAAAGFVFALIEYVINLKPVLVSSLGSELVSSIEGATLGSVTTIVAMKLYSELRGRKNGKDKGSELSGELMKKAETRELKSRIREELELLKEQITQNLENKSFSGKGYSIRVFPVLREILIQKLEARTFRQIDESYDKIVALDFQSNLGDITERNYREAIVAVTRAIKLLK